MLARPEYENTVKPVLSGHPRDSDGTLATVRLIDVSA